MNGLADKLVWFFTNADAHQVVAPLVVPFAIAFGLYQSHYPVVLLRSLWTRVFGDGFVPFSADDAPALGMTMPTLLRNREDLDAMCASIASASKSGYPGRLALMAVVDGLDAAPELVAELRAFVAALSLPPGMVVKVVGSEQRVGKAMAADLGVQELERLAECGEIPALPAIYFNMDADCELGPYALERMVRALMRPSVLTGKPAMIVTSHVAIREEEYFKGWRHLLTPKGLIAVTVAREYLVAIGLGRTNAMRVLPQNGASGALYCTWMEIVQSAPSWGRFLNDLRFSDWVKWWLGAAPPAFDRRKIEPLPEAMTGMGEDTWMSWLACAARWDGDRLTLALPRTPGHAIWYAVVAFFARPFRYDLRAKIYTSTPTSMRALFNQRVRWNVSRIWTVQCWGVGLLFHLSIGIPAIIDVVVATAFQAVVVVALVLAPFAGPVPAMAPALFVLVELAYFVERVLGTTIAMIADPHEKGQWKKLLGLPLAGLFHIAFNVVTTVFGAGKQIFGHGYNDRFAPETTLVKGGTSRIALGFRIRRFYALAWRSVTKGDVPLGWFWLGWHETKWTPNGYQGWTTGKVPGALHPATVVPATLVPATLLPATLLPATLVPASVATPARPLVPASPVVAASAPSPVAHRTLDLSVPVAGTDAYQDDVLPDSGVRRRAEIERAEAATESRVSAV
jgi:hypothetical protein